LRQLLCHILIIVLLPVLTQGSTTQYGSVQYVDSIDLENPFRTIYLNEVWKFQLGDDVAWANPEFDDYLWDDVSTLLGPNQLPLIEWSGIGWFRLTLDVNEDLLGKSLAIDVATQSGASEIYLNGQLIYTFGTVSANPEEEIAWQERKPRSIVFIKEGYNVIAVRYSNHKAQQFITSGYNAGFRYLLVEMNHQVTGVINATRQITIQQYLFSGVLLVFTLIHILLFVFYPKLRQNLYFALFTASFGILNYLNYQTFFSTSGMAIINIQDLQLIFMLSTMIFFLLFSYSLFYDRIPRQFWVFMLSIMTLGTSISLKTTEFYEWLFVLMVIIFIIEIFRTLFVAVYKKRRGSWVFSIGMILFVVSQIFVAALNLEYMSTTISNAGEVASIGGIMALLITMSVSLSRSFADTNHRLETKLKEVHLLSEKAIEQEREKKDREIDRLLLEADNKRKTNELEDARKLQLSMLPHDVPAVGNVEIAVRIRTATEVGGDYYDFALDEQGGMTVAIGDATGHGVKAGIVVATAKSYFNTFAPDSTIVDLLNIMSRGVKNMNLRMIYMALSLVNYKQDTIQIIGAGMPPFLLYKAETGNVKTLLSKGMPLGSVLGFPYEVLTEKVVDNDVLVMMSDGIMESFNSNREQLGLESIIEIVREYGNLPPEKLLDELEKLTSRWIKSSELEDDYTVIVMKFHPDYINQLG
jgi:serine phosphatase RsbU (regulator of sigma subunit)